MIDWVELFNHISKSVGITVSTHDSVVKETTYTFATELVTMWLITAPKGILAFLELDGVHVEFKIQHQREPKFDNSLCIYNSDKQLLIKIDVISVEVSTELSDDEIEERVITARLAL